MNFDLQPHLEGKLVELRPLGSDDFDSLYAVARDPLIWEQHPSNDRFKRDVFEVFFREAMESKGAFAVLDRSTGAIIGSSRFACYDEVRSEIEIGWTFLARTYWGGAYNGEMKSMMISHAFGFVDTIVFKIGAHNTRSRRAVERIGAKLIDKFLTSKGLEGVTYAIGKSDWDRGTKNP